MTNDYTALVAMLDQAAADLQAEIDAAIDRHGLLVRTADQLRAEADGPNVAAEPGAILSVHERCTQEQRDALKQRLVVGGVDHVLPAPPRACTWPGCTFVSSPSGTGSHMAAHRRRTDGAA